MRTLPISDALTLGAPSYAPGACALKAGYGRFANLEFAPAGHAAGPSNGVPGRLVGRRNFLITSVFVAVGFFAGLATTLAASEFLARGLTRLGTKLGLSEGLIGLLAALAADSPELSSAVIALASGAGTVGVGVIVGSNLFNLAALLGLAAIVAGGVRIRRGPLLLDSAVGLFVLSVSAAMVAGLIAPNLSLAVIAPIATGYVLILGNERTHVRSDASHDRPRSTHQSWLPVALIPVALAGVVAGSLAMVHEALVAAPRLHVSSAVLGLIVLAALTSLPNLWVALHFARADRGTALFSSAMNSNTINLVGGLVVPAVFIGAAAARGSLPYFGWLAGLTLLALLAPLAWSRLPRLAGLLIIAIYLVFVLFRVLGA